MKLHLENNFDISACQIVETERKQGSLFLFALTSTK